MVFRAKAGRGRLRRGSVALAAALIGMVGWAASAAYAADQTIQPGLWDSTESYSVLISATNHDRHCLTAAQIQAFLSAPSTKHYRCTYQRRNIGRGEARFAGGACFSHAGRNVLSDVNVEGTYAPDRFHLDMRYRFMLNPKLGVPGTGVIDARRISADCPADLAPGK